MSNQIQHFGGQLNPWNYPVTPARITLTATLVAAAALAAVAGTLAVLASSGVNLHALNALSSLTLSGGSALTGGSLLIGFTAGAWLLTAPRSSKSDEIEEASVESPEPFHLLKQLQENLQPPALRFSTVPWAPPIKTQLQQQTEAFKQRVQSFIVMLHEGHIKVEQSGSQDGFEIEGEAPTTPEQEAMILDFAREQLEAFNQALRKEDAELIDIYTFIEQCTQQQDDPHLLESVEVELDEPPLLLEKLKEKAQIPTLVFCNSPSAPSKEVQLTRQIEAFKERVGNYIAMLNEGHIKVEQSGSQDGFEIEGKAPATPEQEAMILDFAREQLEAFNQALRKEDAELIDIYTFIEQCTQQQDDPHLLESVEVELDEPPLLLEKLKEKAQIPTLVFCNSPSAPSKEVQLTRQIEAFKERVGNYIAMLNEGHIKVEQSGSQDGFEIEGEAPTTPEQEAMILDFARGQLEAFNQALRNEDAELIDIDKFIEQCTQQQDDPHLLETVEVEFDELPVLLEKLKEKAQIPTLVFSDSPSAPSKEAQLTRQIEVFEQRVRGYIAMLFEGHIKIEQTLSQTGIEIQGVPPSTPVHIEMVLKFAREQLKAFNEGLDEEDAIDIEAFMVQYDRVETLAQAWKDLQEASEAGIMELPAILTRIAAKLPDAQDPLWEEYPSMNMQLKITFESLRSAEFFSNYVFSRVDPDDQACAASLTEAYTSLAEKLGCEAPELDIPMYTEDDESLHKAASQLEFQESAQIIRNNFDEFGEAQLAAETLVQLVAPLGDSKRTFAQGILDELPEDISQELAPHLADILFD